MAFRESADICSNPAPLRFDEDYILWHKVKDKSYHGVVEKDGELWCPQRRIYPVETLRGELASAGLCTVFSKWD
jgi:hypothetical protein